MGAQQLRLRAEARYGRTEADLLAHGVTNEMLDLLATSGQRRRFLPVSSKSSTGGLGMNRTFKAAVAASALVGIAGSVALLSAWSEDPGPFKNAIAAYEKGDYASALRLMHPFAKEVMTALSRTMSSLFRSGSALAFGWERISAI